MAAGGPGPAIESFLTCNICMEPFRRPKILPCVHTFCCQCLQSYLVGSVGAANRKKGGFPCPTCRQHVPVAKPSKPPEKWPEQLKDNFVMASMLEALNKQRQIPTPSPPSSPTTTTTTTTTSTDPGARQSVAGSSCCRLQSGTKAGHACHSAPEVVCWDCAVFVCGTCAATAHANCSQVQNIGAAGAEKRQEMLDWLPPLHAQVTELEGRHALAQAFLSSLQARRQALQDHITLAASDAVQMVRLQEQKLRQTMEKEFHALIQRQRQRQKASSLALEDVRSLKEALEQCVAERDLELLRQAQCLKQRYVALVPGAGDAAADVTKEEEEKVEEEEEEDQGVDTGTFLPASLAELKSTVLVGVYHHGADHSFSPLQSPMTSAPASPSTPTSDGTSWCQLQDGPLLQRTSPCQSLPSTPTLPPSAVETDSTEPQTCPDERTAPCSFTNPQLLSGQRPVTCHHTFTFSARAKGDKVEPLIHDLVVLNNGWLVATDTANRCLKCYFKARPDDVKYQCKRLTLTHAPYGVCGVEGHLVAVTVPKGRQLQMVTALPHLAPVTTLPLPLRPQETAWAVSSLGEQRLAVTTCPQGEVGSVLVLQISGDSVQCVARHTSLVTTPLYIAVTSDHHIVVTDPTSCHVVCVTSDSGHAVFHFHTTGKVMAVASHDRLLVVADQSPALSLLTNQGACLHTLPLPKGKAGCPQPRAVAVATDSAVYVSDDLGRLHLFSLRWKDPAT